MALSGEVGELTSLFQWLTPEESDAWREDPALEANVLDEIADVTLYLLQLADRLGVDLAAAAHAKIDRNELRFPPPVYPQKIPLGLRSISASSGGGVLATGASG